MSFATPPVFFAPEMRKSWQRTDCCHDLCAPAGYVAFAHFELYQIFKGFPIAPTEKLSKS